jgi:hypothetical protein
MDTTFKEEKYSVQLRINMKPHVTLKKSDKKSDKSDICKKGKPGQKGSKSAIQPRMKVGKSLKAQETKMQDPAGAAAAGDSADDSQTTFIEKQPSADNIHRKAAIRRQQRAEIRRTRIAEREAETRGKKESEVEMRERKARQAADARREQREERLSKTVGTRLESKTVGKRLEALGQYSRQDGALSDSSDTVAECDAQVAISELNFKVDNIFRVYLTDTVAETVCISARVVYRYSSCV